MSKVEEDIEISRFERMGNLGKEERYLLDTLKVKHLQKERDAELKARAHFKDMDRKIAKEERDAQRAGALGEEFQFYDRSFRGKVVRMFSSFTRYLDHFVFFDQFSKLYRKKPDQPSNAKVQGPLHPLFSYIHVQLMYWGLTEEQIREWLRECGLPVRTYEEALVKIYRFSCMPSHTSAGLQGKARLHEEAPAGAPIRSGRGGGAGTAIY